MQFMEGVIWGVILLTFARARHLLKEGRVLRAMAEVPLGFFACLAIVNVMLGFEGIGPRAGVPENGPLRDELRGADANG